MYEKHINVEAFTAVFVSLEKLACLFGPSCYNMYRSNISRTFFLNDLHQQWARVAGSLHKSLAAATHTRARWTRCRHAPPPFLVYEKSEQTSDTCRVSSTLFLETESNYRRSVSSVYQVVIEKTQEHLLFVDRWASSAVP